jgi:hypothetical protein
MPITVDGSTNTITGVTTNGVPASSITSASLANGAVTQAKLSAPKTVKTSYVFNTPSVIVNSTTWVDIASTTYTPAYSTSTIYVYFNVNMWYGAGIQSADSKSRLLVDGAEFFINERTAGNLDGTGSSYKHSHFDSWSSFSNNTTSARTIKLQGAHNASLTTGVDFGHSFLQLFYIKEVQG